MNETTREIKAGEVELMTRTIPAFLPKVSPRGGAESTASGKFSGFEGNTTGINFGKRRGTESTYTGLNAKSTLTSISKKASPTNKHNLPMLSGRSRAASTLVN